MGTVIRELGDPVASHLGPDFGCVAAAAARERGMLLSVVGPQRVRMLTHLDVDDDGCQHAAKVVAALLGDR